MTKTKIKAFSFTDEEWKQLRAIAEDTGMKDSEIIRELLNKAFIDKKTREIITKENYWRKITERTSKNVQYANEKKDEASHETSSAVSSNCRLNDTIVGKIKQTGKNIFYSGDQLAWESYCTQYYIIALEIINEWIIEENNTDIIRNQRFNYDTGTWTDKTNQREPYTGNPADFKIREAQ